MSKLHLEVLRNPKGRLYVKYKKKRYYLPASMSEDDQKKIITWLLKKVATALAKKKQKPKKSSKKRSYKRKPAIADSKSVVQASTHTTLERAKQADKVLEDSTATTSYLDALRKQHGLPNLTSKPDKKIERLEMAERDDNPMVMYNFLIKFYAQIL